MVLGDIPCINMQWIYVVSMCTYTWMTFSEFLKPALELSTIFYYFFPHLKEGFAAHFAVEEVFPEGSRQNAFPRSATSLDLGERTWSSDTMLASGKHLRFFKGTFGDIPTKYGRGTSPILQNIFQEFPGNPLYISMIGGRVDFKWKIMKNR